MTSLGYQEIELASIAPNPLNPRKTFEGPKFDELVASIREKGVLQPIVVRPLDGIGGEENTYEIVAGERRWRAAMKLAEENGGGEARIPAMVRALTDDETFEVMTIENLQREDLNEREEAETFKSFLDRKGEKALPELAERTGIDPRYIRRRVHILTLPKEMLAAWEKGKLAYGHMGQLLRIRDQKERARLFKDTIAGDRWGEEKGQTFPVSWLKEQIDQKAISLDGAYFDKVACQHCSHNSASNLLLFGVEDLAGAHCLDAKCFKGKQNAHLMKHWKESPLGKKHRTSGFRFADNLQYEKFREFGGYREIKPTKNCFVCGQFVSRIHLTDERRAQIVCLNAACFDKEMHKQRPSQETKNLSPSELRQKTERRRSEQGNLFRETFFQERIPRAFAAIQPEDLQVDKLALTCLLYSNRKLHSWFYEQLDEGVQRAINPEGGSAGEPWFRLEPDEIWKAVEILATHPKVIRLLLHEAELQAVMQPEFGHDGRYRVAQSLGTDLQKEWQIHEAYLKAKTKAEIMAMGESLGILKDQKTQSFLYEKLGKKRGKFEACKKGELIRAFLESGVDLAGKVPEEILVKERKCRVCGCTDDHAWTGGCFWVEEDLCSACAAKKKGKGRKGK